MACREVGEGKDMNLFQISTLATSQKVHPTFLLVVCFDASLIIISKSIFSACHLIKKIVIVGSFYIYLQNQSTCSKNIGVSCSFLESLQILVRFKNEYLYFSNNFVRPF